MPRRTKEALAIEIADTLGIPRPTVSEGASVYSRFIDEVHRAKFGSDTGGADSYRRTEQLLNRLGESYDPWWDTSESRGNTGGSTVTTRAFSRILTAITGTPRCFLVPWSERSGPLSYQEYQKQADGDAFAEAGPGTLVLAYEAGVPGQAKVHGAAIVTNMLPGWRTIPWTAEFGRLEAFEEPRILSIAGLQTNRPTEISWSTYQAIMGETRADHGSTHSASHHARVRAVAERIDQSYPTDGVPINQIFIPPIDLSDVHPIDETDPKYFEISTNGHVEVMPEADLDPAPTSMDQNTMRIVEKRAIEYATRALRDAGWTLVLDRQRDGVGYDLEFQRRARTLKVEVKGIQGASVIFNLTRKEWWRAMSDPNWILIAVTRVLSPSVPYVNVIPRTSVITSRRIATGYRIWV